MDETRKGRSTIILMTNKSRPIISQKTFMSSFNDSTRVLTLCRIRYGIFVLIDFKFYLIGMDWSRFKIFFKVICRK